MKKTIRFSTLISIFLIAGCASTTAGTIGSQNGRSQLLLIPSSEVNQMALQYFTEQNTAARKANVLVTSGPTFDRVRTIMSNIIAQTPVFRPDAIQWPWELVLIKDKELNAHVMPGGKVTVYTGLIEQLKLTDDEIAAILGHEISHALREHTREKISQEKATDLGLQLLGAFAKLPAGSMQALGLAKQLGLDLPNSRSMETEADIYGLELAARAGYNPKAAITLWQKMIQSGDGEPPQFLSTHPSSETRIRDLEGMIARVMPLYEVARGQRKK